MGNAVTRAAADHDWGGRRCIDAERFVRQQREHRVARAGTVIAGLPMLPLGLRADAAYNQSAVEAASGGGLAGARQSVTSATLNLTYRLPMPNSPLSPYIITGLGGYHATCGGATCTSSTRLGWNAGLGTKVMVLGLRTFVEGRYHSADRHSGDANYFPITLGVTF
ncbi:MAG: porin family protein [Gemmatimonadetes bacterium]|nr:porin family protein [Gemmatimonadota bacterium]